MVEALLLLSSLAVCGVPTPSSTAVQGPDYYTIDLVGTRRVDGTGLARGRAEVGFVPSPFGIALAPDGSYRLGLTVHLEALPVPESGRYVAWVTTREVDRVRLLGPLEPRGDDRWGVQGEVEWNKFLVVITLEAVGAALPDPTGSATGERQVGWTGPIILRGMSRSGSMHTMAGHGPFEQESCTKYGYE